MAARTGLSQSVVPPARRPRHSMVRLSPSPQRATAMRLICLSVLYCRPRPAASTCCRRYAPHSPRQNLTKASAADLDVGYRACRRYATLCQRQWHSRGAWRRPQVGTACAACGRCVTPKIGRIAVALVVEVSELQRHRSAEHIFRLPFPGRGPWLTENGLALRVTSSVTEIVW